VTDKKEDMLNSPERLNYVGNRDKLLIILSFVAYGVALAIGVLSGEILVIVVLLIPLWVAIVYSVRLSPNLPRVKDIFVAKSLAVTASLVFSTLLLAYICSRNNFLVLFWGYFLFLKIFINTTLFDVRDVSGDRKVGVRTIPAVLGVKKTRMLLLSLNSLLIPWVIISLYLHLFVSALPLLLFCIFYGYWYILHFCRPEKKFSFSYDVLVDGEWMILSVLFILTRPFGF